MLTCKKCGCMIPEEEACTINAGTSRAYHICESCHDSMWDADEITKCVSCGEWYEYDVLENAGQVGGDSFVPCPSCGCDIVDGMSREERLADAQSDQPWAVTCVYNGSSTVTLFPDEIKARSFLFQSFDSLASAAKAKYGENCTTAIYPEFSRAFVCCKLENGKENRTEFYCSQVQS